PYYGYAVITRGPGSDTWVDLFGGPEQATAGAGSAGGSIRAVLMGRVGPTAGGPAARVESDAAFAARIANYAGEWPDDDSRSYAEPRELAAR
ncbi:hypothetical protein, partial [Curtobacterium sp. P97]|uniref:hypothetical protein n=1 Tax=Curtobacterium sp. P97 TaxID=2939562 RepID=UPI002041BCA9